MFGIKFLIVIFCFGGVYIHCQQKKSIGDPCTLKSTGNKGICKLGKDCVRENLREKIHPQRCGLQGKESIVCCEKSKKAQVSPRKPGAISKKKCRRYAKYVRETKRLPILLIDAPMVEKNQCGHKVVKLIIGGEPAGRKEFPHMAVIGYDTPSGDVEWACGGSIISNRYILTAGHCLLTKYGPAKYVKIGITNLKDRGNRKQEFKAAKLIPFPQYKPPSHYHDIGLIKLNRRAKMNPYASPACLHFNEKIKADKAIATGWGTTERDVSSDDLLKVTLDLFSHKDCNFSYKNQISRKLANGIMDDVQLCAGSKNINKQKDTCQGDSGGPLQIYHVGDGIKCMYDIVGVTSFGKTCRASLGVYTRVSHYIKWIEDIVWP